MRYSAKTIAYRLGELGKRYDNSKELSKAVHKFVEEYQLHQQLPQIIAYLKRIDARHQEFTTPNITVPEKPTKTLINQIKKAIGMPASHAHHQWTDPSLIAGFSVSYNGKRYEANIKNDLQALYNHLVS